MQLWTDYEGVTIDGAFPLQKLLLPEGRSAFFSTASAKGEPMVVRLIECHFDEEEILARWRCVEALSHPNFLKFERFGQTELDGRAVVYAVFEKVDANLAGVLDQGHLTVKDGSQLACSLVAALEVLHNNGFIHEHIEPRNIFAVGEVVKLRSDCIREAPEGEEGRVAKKRDVCDLARVLLQALTQRQSVEGVPDFAMPAPFGAIIRNGIDGTWELENIKAALAGLSGSKQPAAPKPQNGTPATPAVAEQKAPSAARPPQRPQVQLSLPLLNEDRKAGFARAASRKVIPDDRQTFGLDFRWFGAVGFVALLLVISTWALAQGWNAHRQAATQAVEGSSQQNPQAPKQVSANSSPKSSAVNSGAALRANVGARAGWRVIPYTYNRRMDAEKKVSSLASSHPELQPAVFTPSGHAPYLISIGGIMDRNTAYALAHRSASLGLPHDTFAQDYSH